MDVHTPICLYVHTHIYMFIFLCIYICVWRYVNMHTCVCVSPLEPLRRSWGHHAPLTTPCVSQGKGLFSIPTKQIPDSDKLMLRSCSLGDVIEAPRLLGVSPLKVWGVGLTLGMLTLASRWVGLGQVHCGKLMIFLLEFVSHWWAPWQNITGWGASMTEVHLLTVVEPTSPRSRRGRVGLCGSLSPWGADGHLPTACSQGLSPEHSSLASLPLLAKTPGLPDEGPRIGPHGSVGTSLKAQSHGDPALHVPVSEGRSPVNNRHLETLSTTCSSQHVHLVVQHTPSFALHLSFWMS